MHTLEARVLNQFSKAVVDALIEELGLFAGRFHFTALDTTGAVIAGWCASPGADPDDPAGDSGVTMQYCPGGQLQMPVTLTFVNRGVRVLTTMSLTTPDQGVGTARTAPLPPPPPSSPQDPRPRSRPTPIRRPKR